MEKDEKMKDEKENIKRRQGEHLPPGKVKIEIIKYILSQPDSVPGQDIKEYLRTKCRIADEKNIREHLKALQGKYIEKTFGKPGIEHEWDITKFESLKRINKDYSEIRLNGYRKSLIIVSLERAGSSLESKLRSDKEFLPNSLNGHKFLLQLMLSDSFFEKCLENDLKTLYSQSYELYKYDEGYKEDQDIQILIDEVCNEFIERVTLTSDRFFVSDIKKSVFREALGEIFFRWGLEPSEDSYKKALITELSAKITEKTLSRIIMNSEKIIEEGKTLLESLEEEKEVINTELFEKGIKLIDISHMGIEEHLKIIKEYSKGKLQEEIFGKITYYPDLCNKIMEIKTRQAVVRILSYDSIFKYCFESDVLKKVASPDEIDFMRTFKSDRAFFAKELKENPLFACENYNRFRGDEDTPYSIILYWTQEKLGFNKKVFM